MSQPQLSFIVSLYFLSIGLISREAPSRSPAFYRYQPCVCVCVCVGMNCVQNTWPLSLLFSLKSCGVAEQKATSRSPPLRVGIAVYFYLRVEVAVMEAATAPFSPTAFQFAVTSSAHFHMKSIWQI